MEAQSNHDRLKHLRSLVPEPFDADKNGASQTKWIFAAIGVVIVLWLGVLLVLGHALLARIFA